MEKKRSVEVHRIEEALIAAHRMQGVAEPHDSFVGDVMFRVRAIGRHPLHAGENGSGIEPRTVWGFAAASGVLALLFLFYSLSVDLSGIQYQIAQSLLGDPSTLMLAETFAVI